MDRSNKDFDTLIPAIKAHGQSSDRGITFINSSTEERFVSYVQLYEKAVFALGKLQQMGLSTGDQVIIQLEDNETFIIMFWACILGGIVPAPLSTGNQDHHMHKLMEVAEVLDNSRLICEPGQVQRLEKFAAKQGHQKIFKKIVKQVIQIDHVLKHKEAGTICKAKPSDIAYIQFSSGSTGAPKGVVLTHQNLVCNTGDIASRSQIKETDRMLSWMPLTHDMGLICFHLTGVVSGINQYLMPTALFIRRPLLWIEKASEHKASLLYSPNFGYSYFLSAFQSYKAEKAWDLKAVKLIYNGAEPISMELCQRFMEALSTYGLSATSMFPGYGLAEASVAVCLPTVGDELKDYTLDRKKLKTGEKIEILEGGHQDGISFMEVGRPIDHCEVRIADDNDQPLEACSIGHIQIKGGNVTSGYYNRPEATNQLFTKDGWLRSGDLGFMIDGKLVVTGRNKNIIIVNGQNFYPQDIERACESIEGIDLGKIVACGIVDKESSKEELILFVLFKGKDEKFFGLASELRHLILEKFGLNAAHIIPVRKIPKTTSGKIQHFSLKKEYLNGEFDEKIKQLKSLGSKKVSALSGHELMVEIRSLTSEVFAVDDLENDTNFFELGITSLQATQLATRINDQFGYSIGTQVILDQPSVRSLARKLEESGIATENAPFEACPEQTYYDLSETQKRFWVLDQSIEHPSALNIAVGFEINGHLDEHLFEKAARLVFERHEGFRSTFSLVDQDPKQVIHPVDQLVPAFAYEDISDFNDPNQQLEKLINEEALVRFDLERDSLLQVRLIKKSEEQYIFLCTMHHIISDGWSVLLVLDELATNYNQLSNDPNYKLEIPPLQQKDHTFNKRSGQIRESYIADKKYWLSKFRGELPKLTLPITAPQNDQSGNGGILHFELPETTTSNLAQVSKDAHGTMFMTLMAAVNVLIYKYTNGTDIIIGTDIAGRDQSFMEKIVGCFIKTFAIRSKFDSGDRFSDLLTLVKNQMIEAFDHQNYSYEQLINDLNLNSLTDYHTLFDVLVVFQNFDRGHGFEAFSNGVKATPYHLPVNTALVDLHFEFIEQKGRLTYTIRYNADKYGQEHIESLGNHLNHILYQIGEDADMELSDYQLCSVEEKSLINSFQGKQMDYPNHECVIEWFELQAEKSAEEVAIIFDENTFTYRDINESASRLASFLREQKGISSGSRIGVLLTPSEKSLITILAIMKAGATLVPLSTSFPNSRIQYIARDSQMKLLIADEANPSVTGVPILDINAALEEANRSPIEKLEIEHSSEDIAYIFYTSGTTGKPKGVLVHHGAVLDYVQTFSDYFEINDQDIVIHQSELSFDTSIEEIFPTLCNGGTLNVMKEGGKNVAAILAEIEAGRATVLSSTPIVLDELNKIAGDLSTLRILISGGDQLKASHIDKLIHKTNIYNTYGPTETTVCATYNRILSANDCASIGKPIANHKVYILNEQMAMMPIGVEGEICIAGPGVTKGYANNEKETALKFVKSPFGSDEIIYKTGDLGKWNKSGEIEFVGRKDHQVKVNGYRIELEEIEHAMLLIDGVGDVVIQPFINQDQKQQIAAYYIGSQHDTNKLRALLQEELPYYMVPSYFIRLDVMPVNAHGKIDRQALPKPDESTKAITAIVPAENAAQEKMLKIWQNTLDIDEIGITDNFFELGGNSILGTKIVARVQDQFNARCSLRDVFSYPTISKLTAFIVESDQTDLQMITPVDTADSYEVSHAQKRMWILDQFKGTKEAYHLSWAYTINGELNSQHLQNSIRQIITRHESLRTNFILVDGEPHQVINEQGITPFELKLVDLQDKNSTDEISEFLDSEVKTAFDLTNDLLIRGALIRKNANEHIFSLCIHHIVSDGLSMEIFVDELTQYYNALCNNEKSNLTPLKFHYKDFVAWQKQQLQSSPSASHKAYWLSEFAEGPIPMLELPTDFPRPLSQSYRGDVEQMVIDADLKRELVALGAEHNTSLFAVLLSAVYTMLYKYTDQRDIVVGTPVAGREVQELENQMGLFINTLAIRTQLDPDHSFEDLMRRVSSKLLSATDHQIFPFDELVDMLDLELDTSRSPLFDVMVGYQNKKLASNQLSLLQGVSVEEYPASNHTSQFDLSIDFFEEDSEVRVCIEYNTDLFTQSYLTRFLDQFKCLLRNIKNQSHKPLAELDILPSDQKAQLLAFNGDNLILKSSEIFQDRFEAQVLETPNAPAVIFEGKVLTYAEVNQKANQLAHYLRDKVGVNKNDHIGLLLERTDMMVVYVIGVIKSGAAYVPIDPEYPEERINLLIEDSGMKILLADVADQAFKYRSRVEKLSLNVLDLTGYPTTDPEVINCPDDSAYMIYTSGSTGRPKGVKVSHGNLNYLIESWQHHYHLREMEVCTLQMASMSFDVFVGDLCRTLLVGGKLVICPADDRVMPDKLTKLIVGHGITIMESTPALILPMMDHIAQEKINALSLQLLIIGSDTCLASDFQALQDKFGDQIRIINSYGTTETTIDASFFEGSIEGSANSGVTPIGKPMLHNDFYILDFQGALQPIGVAGELCIGGKGVSLGYHNQEGINEDKFLENNFSGDGRYYKTGDLARWKADGNVEFLGRKDFQVKIRGYRIELGEIEDAISQFDGIAEAIVLAWEENDEYVLTAYYTTDKSFDEDALRTWLQNRLPNYMVPTIFVEQQDFVLTPNGKIDRKALGKPDFEALRPTMEYKAPSTPVEISMTAIWESILDKQRIGTENNFFELGGHSLKAARVIAAIHQTFSVNLGLRALFTHATIASLSRLVEQTAHEKYNNISKTAPQENYALSHAQRRLWLLTQIDEDSRAYNMPVAYDIKGKLDLYSLKNALTDLCNRHEILRTVLVVDGSEPRQKVLDQIEFELSYEELSSADLSKEETDQKLAEEIDHVFDLTTGPLFVGKIFKISKDHHLLYFNMHHIISDGWSVEILVRELTALYNHYQAGKSLDLKPLPIQYKDYAAWQNEVLDSSQMKSQETYWLDQFQGPIPMLALPTDRPRPIHKTYNGAAYAHKLSNEQTVGLKHLALNSGTTLFMTLMAGLKALFYRYSNQEDMIIGFPVAGRSQSELEDQIGFYVNTLGLRTQFSGDESFDTLLHKVKDGMLAAFSNQDYPFDLLVDNLDLVRDLSRSPLFDVMVVLQSTEVQGSDLDQMNELRVTPYHLEATTSKFDLIINFIEADEHLDIVVEYNSDLFDSSRISAMLVHFEQLLAAILDDTSRPLSELPYLSTDEQQKLLPIESKPAVDYPKGTTIHALFEKRAKEQPEAIAIAYDGRELTYAELNERANQLAFHLKDKHHTAPGDLIGIMMSRSERMIIGILGILKSGSAYVPIDPEYPEERRNYILQDAGIKKLVHDGLADITKTSINAEDRVDLDALIASNKKGRKRNPKTIGHSHSPAYVIYTSGSSGLPKGVLIEHNNVIRLMTNSAFQFDFSAYDVWTLFHSICFDFSVWEMFGALLYGGKLVIVPKEIAQDTSAFAGLLSDQQVTVLNQIPGVFNHLTNEILNNSSRYDLSLRYVIFGGEALNTAALKEWNQSYPSVELINMYGITETTVHTTFKKIGYSEIMAGGSNIGKAIPTVDIYLLDKNLGLIPDGVVGEICVGGEGVARGYLNRPELTHERFVNNPYKKGERLYLSGDLGVRINGGDIEYMGRKDFQVKIRGYRIELGEIEDTLIRHQKVSDSCVLAHHNDGEDYLVAYFTSTGSVDPAELRSWLDQHLPSYMIPAFFMPLAQFPLTSNGKVDRKALPVPDKATSSALIEYIPPKTETEVKITEIWKSVLNMDKVSATANFFEIGGHSLKASRVMSRIHEEFSVAIGIKALFTHPTIQALSALVDDSTVEEYAVITKREVQPDYALSHAQKRLWILDQIEEDRLAYHMPVVYELTGVLDIDALKQAFQSVIDRHEILRTSFIARDGEPRQKIHEDLTFDWNFMDLSDQKLSAKEIRRIHKQETDQVFDLANDPLLRATLVRLNPTKHHLIFCMHHIISDGWSTEVLFSELTQCYNDHHSNMQLSLSDLPIQYTDYSEWQWRKMEEGVWLNSEKYWQAQFDGDLPVLNLPTDRPRPAIKTFRGASVSKQLAATQTRLLRELAKEKGMSLFMLLMASVKALLYKYSGQEDLIVGFPVAGRDQKELESQIGFFVNTVALRTQFTASDDFDALMTKVKNQMLEAFNHQEYPFDQLLENLALKRDISRSPLFDVMVVFQNTINQKSTSGSFTGLEVSEITPETTVSKFDLILNFQEGEDHINFLIEYNTDLFDADRIERMMDHFIQLLTSILADPTQPLSKLSYLTKQEEELLLPPTEMNHDDSCETIISTLFEKMVARQPDKTALVFEERSLTYHELNQQANQLAHYLRNHQGVKPNELIGLMADRSEQMIIGMLGIIKSGAAYVPIDIEYPTERRHYMIKNAGINCLLCSHIDPELDKNVKQLELQNSKIAKEDSNNPVSVNTPDDLIYVIHTSGTTGRPKGVQVMHKSVVNLSNWLNDLIYSSSEDQLNVALTASIGFDSSVKQIFPSLLNGASLTIISEQDKKDLFGYIDTLKKKQINVLDITPSFLTVVLDALQNTNTDLGKLKYTLVGGEALKSQLAENYYKTIGDHSQLINVYGVTEATVDSTFEVVPKKDRLSPKLIGKLLPNTQAYVLDRDQQLLPKGSIGELYLGGIGVAKGYVHQPELTKERFIENPFKAGDVLYKTGDLARWFDKENLEFLGRNDRQVNLKGYRIEQGEIENRLLDLDEISESVVLLCNDGHDNAYLQAFYVSEPPLDASNIRKQLIGSLPEYMIPLNFIHLEGFPKTSHHKIDYKALQDLVVAVETKPVAPVLASSELERELVEIWQQALGRNSFGILDNFFELGGDSLKAMKVFSEIYKKFNTQLSIKNLFTSPTIKELAKTLESSVAEKFVPIPKVALNEKYELSNSQKRLWILDQFAENDTSYNIPIAYRFTGNLDKEAFSKTIDSLVERHEILRTNFITEGGQPWQIVHRSDDYVADYKFINLCNESDQDARLNELAESEIATGFDLASDQLLRVKLVALSDREHVCLLTLHHIVSDALSNVNLKKDISTFYQFHKDGTGHAPRSLGIQYKDFVAWQKENLSGSALEKLEDYWKTKLSRPLHAVELPTGKTRPKIRTSAGKTVSFRLKEGHRRQLTQIGADQNATLFMVLTALVKGLLYRYTSQNDLVITTPIAGREHPDLADQVGFYANTLALRTGVSGEDTFGELLSKVQETIVGAYEHQAYPFDMLTDNLDIPYDPGYSPLSEVMIVVQEAGQDQLQLPDLEVSLIEVENSTVRFDLLFVFNLNGDDIDVELVYNTAILDEDLVSKMQIHFENMVTGILADKHQKIGNVAMLTKAEMQPIIQQSSDVTPELPSNLQDKLSKNLNSDAPAISLDSVTHTYRELDQLTDQILSHISDRYQVSAGDHVMIDCHELPNKVVALLMLIKTGWVGIDPKEIDFISNGNMPNPKLVLTDYDLPDRLESIPSCRLDEFDLERNTHLNIKPFERSADSPIYFTTDKDNKGNSVGRYLRDRDLLSAMKHGLDFHENDRWLIMNRISAADQAWEMLSALLSGACMLGTPADSTNLSEPLKPTIVSATAHEVKHWMKPQVSNIDWKDLRIAIIEAEGAEGFLSSNCPKGLTEADKVFILRSALHGGPVAYEKIDGFTSRGFDNGVGDIEIDVTDQNGQTLPNGLMGTIQLRKNSENLQLITDNTPTSEFETAVWKTGFLGIGTSEGRLKCIGRVAGRQDIEGKTVTDHVIRQTLDRHPAVADLAIWPKQNKHTGYELAIVPDYAEAFTIRQILKGRAADPELFDGLYYLPNGAAIYQINNSETDFTYDEIFTQHGYLKHGIEIKAGDVIFDVGANIGMFSLYASLNFEGTSIYSFEPLYPIFKVLSANASLYPETNIRTFNIGLSSEEEEATFTYYKQNTIISGRFSSLEDEKATVRSYLLNQFEEDGITLSDKRLEELVEESTASEDYTCRLRRLSDVIEEQKIEQIDLLKIDVEKSELEILEGINTKDWNKIKQIIIEVHDIDGRLAYVSNLLESKGFQITVEQDEILKDTNLYNIYGVLGEITETQAFPSELTFDNPGKWTDPEAFTAYIRATCLDQMPTTFSEAVNLSLVGKLPLDANGLVDLATLEAELIETSQLTSSAAEYRDVVVSSTFTSEPFEPYATWWSQKFNLELNFEFSAYNQVMQDLIAATQSPRHETRLILLRFEDLIRELGPSTPTNKVISLLDSTFEQLRALLTTNSQKHTMLVGVFPETRKEEIKDEIRLHLQKINKEWRQFLGKLTNVFVVDLTQIEEHYNLQKIYDKKSDSIGHIPYTEIFYAAMGTSIARMARALFQPSSKVIALDCDNTLWSGVCGEVGPQGVEISEGHRQLQKFCLQKYNEGFLLVIASKNNEEDVWQVFDEHPDMILQKEHFVNWRINWEHKSANLRGMADELNVGIDSFCFLDDSLVECHEVMTNCPEILTIQMPSESQEFTHMIRHLWSLDKLNITGEDKKRSEMYKAEQKRQAAGQEHMDLDHFIADLNIEILLSPVNDENISRLSQLTDRTNQFNCNKEIYGEIELRTYLNRDDHFGWGVEVRDKYGSYGITGLIMAQTINNHLVIDTFLLSCRVLGRKIEFALTQQLLEMCQSMALDGLLIRYKENDRNAPALKFIQLTGAQKHQDAKSEQQFYLSSETQLTQADDVRLYPGEFWPDQEETVVANDSAIEESFVFDHIGVAVRDIEKAGRAYAALGYKCYNKIYDPIQNVWLMICEKHPMDRIELVAPFDKNSPVNHILEINGDLPYHTCYKVESIERTLEYLAQQFEFEVIGKPEKAILFNNKLVQFIQVKEIGLIELLEDPDGLTIDTPTATTSAIKLTVMAFDLSKAASFYQKLGYHKGDASEAIEDGISKLCLSHPNGAPDIEIQVPQENETIDEYKFLLKNNAHAFSISMAEIVEDVKLTYLKEKSKEKEVTAYKDWKWEQKLTNVDRLAHRAFYHVLTYSTQAALCKFPVNQKADSGKAQNEENVAKNAIEIKVAKIWSEILKQDNIGVTEQFIKLGGNSIKATQLLSRLEEAFKVDIGLSEFFNHATIRGLSKLIEESAGSDYLSIPTVEKQPYYDVSHSQSRLWYAYQMDPDQIMYNIPALYKIEGEFDVIAFRKAIVGIVDRHESLRTVFKEIEGVPKQLILPTPDADEICPVVVIDTSDEIMNLAKEMVCTPFDLEEGPLMKTWLFQTGVNEYYFCQVMHHIVSDGWSVNVEINDLLYLYNWHKKSASEDLAPLPIQYKDFAAWERRQLEGNDLEGHRQYWLDQFENETSRLVLPYDQPRPELQRSVGAISSFALDENLTSGIRQFLQTHDFSTFMLMMGLVKVLLYKLSGQSDLIVGIPFANRSHRDLEDQIGFYVNTLPIRTELDANATFIDSLKAIKENMLRAYDHGIYPFDKLLEDLQINPDPSRSPLFDVMLQMQDKNFEDIDYAMQPEGINITGLEIQKGTSKYDLLFNVIDKENTILIDIEYNSDLFYKETIQKLKSDLISLLQEITRQPETKLTTLRKQLLETTEKTNDQSSKFITQLGEDF